MDGFLASALAAFFGGALSFLSPCVLPLVPGYLCFAAGLQFSELSALEEKGEATARILPGALALSVASLPCLSLWARARRR